MTVLLEIVLVAVVIFAVAAFAVSGVGAMSEAGPDAGDDGLPPGRLGPGDLDRTRFGLAFRGYRMAEVDRVLDRLRDDMAASEAELATLREATATTPVSAEPATKSGADPVVEVDPWPS